MKQHKNTYGKTFILKSEEGIRNERKIDIHGISVKSKIYITHFVLLEGVLVPETKNLPNDRFTHTQFTVFLKKSPYNKADFKKIKSEIKKHYKVIKVTSPYNYDKRPSLESVQESILQMVKIPGYHLNPGYTMLRIRFNLIDSIKNIFNQALALS